MAGLGQFNADSLGWGGAPYGVQGRKPTSELSPGARKNLSVLGMGQKMKKGFYGDEEDLDSCGDFNQYFNPTLFGKEIVGGSSGQPFSSNLYGQTGNSSIGMLQHVSRSLQSQQFSRGTFSTNNSIVAHPQSSSSTNSSIHNFPTGYTGSLTPQQQQQPSPNSLLSLGTTRNLLNPTSLSAAAAVNRDMKRWLPGSSSSSGGRGFPQGMLGLTNSASGLVSSFGNSDSGPPPPLDLSEFPSLTSRRADPSNSIASTLTARPAYVGMVKQPISEPAEFQIHNEDFPALPGSQVPESASDSSSKVPGTNSENSKESGRFPGDKNMSSHKTRGIQTTPDGKVINIPMGMVTDQFGIVGLLTFIRAAETDPNLTSLALGSDLTTLGLNLNSPEILYSSFGGPLADVPCRPQDIDYHVPSEYLTNASIRDKLAPIKFNRYGEDLLFFLFYTNCNDILQIASATELYNRDWRYHKEEQVWLMRAPGMPPVEKTNTYERGMYYYFDVDKWRKIAKEFHLDYEKLEDRPHMSPTWFSSSPFILS